MSNDIKIAVYSNNIYYRTFVFSQITCDFFMQVHTDVTIGEVVPPILDQMTDHGANEQASHIGPTFNNDGGTSSLDFVVDLISASVIPAAYPQSTTTDMMTSEPAVHTRTQHTLPNEIPRPDSTIDDRPLLPTAHP